MFHVIRIRYRIDLKNRSNFQFLIKLRASLLSRLFENIEVQKLFPQIGRLIGGLLDVFIMTISDF
jgi:hypothetical protein